MCVQATAKRRRRQAMNGYAHLAKKQRPHYRRHALLDVGQAIAAERSRAAREAARKGKKRK